MSQRSTFSFVACLLSISLLGPAHADKFDPARFVESRCTACHDSNVYTRSKRRVTNLHALQRQVRMCDANIGTKLFEDDLNAVVQYLNDKYYQFK